MAEIKDLSQHVGESVTLQGWVEGTRGHGKVAFLVLRDGTGIAQCVLVKSQLPEEVWETHGSLTPECVAEVTGEVKEDARAPGGYEIGVSGLELHSRADDYPIQPKEHGVDFLLDRRHLWLRTSQQRAGLRVRA
ncbi:MAG: OB-fold nucleic acid binding domain-containing protein, partial [Gemmatimonadota bacterium]